MAAVEPAPEFFPPPLLEERELWWAAPGIQGGRPPTKEVIGSDLLLAVCVSVDVSPLSVILA